MSKDRPLCPDRQVIDFKANGNPGRAIYVCNDGNRVPLYQMWLCKCNVWVSEGRMSETEILAKFESGEFREAKEEGKRCQHGTC